MGFAGLSKALAAATIALSSINLVTAASNVTATSSAPHVPFVIEATWGPTDPSKGLSRDALLVNGSFPGPPLKLKVGETVDFTVINNTPNVTGVHFHGIRQLGTPWADGVPGVNQYAIKTGASYTYTWTAEDPGVYFYHAHYKGQMMDGLYGAIIISPADDAQTPYGLIGDAAQLKAAAAKVEPVFISDWSQFTFSEFFAIEKAANIDNACTDSIILNGQGSVYCPGIDVLTANAAPQVPQILNGTSLTAKGCIPASNPLIQGQFPQNLAALPPAAYDTCTPYEGSNFTYTVDPKAGYAALSFINPGGFAIMQVTVDSHKLIVYEVNGNFIVPQTVDEITVGNGDRISFFVKLNQAPGDYTIRVANAGINQVISGFGVLSYKGSSGAPSATGLINYGGQNLTTITSLNRALAAPFPAVSVAATADATFVLDILKDPSQPTEAWAWTLSGSEAYDQSRDDEVPPLLYQNPADIAPSDLILKTKFNQWIDLIIKVSGPVAEPHPIHKHANKFFAIGAGVGDFNFTTVAQAQSAGLPFNLQNPPYVDGFTSIPAEGSGTWMVFRYQANTPGAWLLHCHVQTHFSGGMAVAILDAIDNFPQVPPNVGQLPSGSGNGTDGHSPSGSGSTTIAGGSGGSGSLTTVSGGVPTSVTGSGSGSGSGTGAANGNGSGSGSGSDSGFPAGASSTSTATGSAAVSSFTGAASTVRPAGFAFGLLAMAGGLLI